MAPMRSHIFDLFLTKKTTVPVTFWYGARSKREIFYEEQFEEIAREHENFRYEVALSEPNRRITGPVIRDSFIRSFMITT